MEEKNGFDWGAVLTAFGIGFPFYLMLAPKWMRKELCEHTGKWIAFFIVVGVIAIVWDRIKKRKK